MSTAPHRTCLLSSISLALALTCLTAGCRSQTEAETPLPGPSEQSAAPERAPEPAQPMPSPAVLEVHNDTSEALKIDITWGRATPFKLVPLAEPAADAPALVLHDRPHPCDCPCDAVPCVDCAEPRDEIETLAPGRKWSFPWDGRVRTTREGDNGERCFEPTLPAPGRYRLEACAMGHRCGAVELDLPAPDRVEVHIGEPS